MRKILIFFLMSIFLISFITANPFGYNYLEQTATGSTDLTDYYTKLQVNAINTSMKNYVDGLGGGGISWATATNGTLRLTDNNTFYPNMAIGTSNQFGLLHIDGGIDNSTINGKTTELGGYIANALISIGIYQNHLLRTEVYGTTWVRVMMTVINNGDYSPAYTLTAEHLNVTNTSGYIHQGVTNITNGTWTYSQWMRCRSGTTCLVGMEINSTGQVGQVKNHTVATNWERYYVTQNINLTHTRIHVLTRTYGSNISVWGSQLEIGNEPRPYSGARTTTNLSAFTSTTLFRTPIASTGRGSFVGVAVGGGLSGATTGSFSGAVSTAALTTSGLTTHNIANTQRGNITGLFLNNPTPANSTHPRYWIQNPPSIYFNGTATNGTNGHQKTSAYQILMNITNGTTPTNYLSFNTISGNGASLIVTEVLRLNNSVTTLNSSLNQTRGNTTINNIYGGMWYHNHTATELNFAVDGTFYQLYFINATHLNGFGAEGLTMGGASNLTTQISGVYLVNYMASGDGQNNHAYFTSVFINGVNQDNCENHHKMAAGGDVITQTGTCIINLAVNDKVSLRTADVGGTGTGNYYSANIDLVRIGN